MPWKIAVHDGKYCVVLEATGKPIPGGCHDSKKDAIAHLVAVQINAEQDEKKK